MRINLTTPMTDDKERQQRNKAVLDAIEQYTEERMDDAYGRIHTDGSRSGGQPTQSDCEVAASIRSALYRACSNMPNYPKGIVEPFVAAHHRHGYDQGYYDGCTRQLTHHNAVAAGTDRIGGGGGLPCGVVGVATQSDALKAENEQLRHDLERQMTIANEHVNEAERLRRALAHIAFSGADGPYGEFGEALNEHQMRRVAKAALKEQSK